MTRISLVLVLIFFAPTIFAEQRIRPDGMGGWVVEDNSIRGLGGVQGWNDAEQAWQQQQLKKQQIENQKLQNELLRRQLQQQQPSAGQIDYSKTSEFQSWQAANPWFGSDRPKTEFALLYAKQLRQESPDLAGRPFYDAVSVKVAEVFGANK